MSHRRDESGENPPQKEQQPAAPPSAEARIAELEAQLRQKSEEAAANYDRYLRAVADGENLKKRVQREKVEAIRFANEALLRDLLSIVDNLETALEHAELGGNGKSVVEGVQLILRMFRDLLERQGVKELGDPTGQSFDPQTQEAGAVEPNREVQPNTVIRQQVKGYKFNDRLLRPARVVVAADTDGQAPGGTKESSH